MVANNGKLPLPLEGVRILDATHIVAGPFCSMILADMGAEVIKIERPGGGDRARNNKPIIEKPDGQRVSARFLGVNRNKKSVTLDLRDPRGKAVFHELIRVSEALLDNWGPGALRRLGLGYDDLRQVNSSLVYASITGYGDSDALRGPYSKWPANNPCVQGMGGWMEVTGPPGSPPQMVGDNIGDSVPGCGRPWGSYWRWKPGARPVWVSTWTWRCTTAWWPTPPAPCLSISRLAESSAGPGRTCSPPS